ncbi:MAG: DUF1513 domain-containing protein [Hyphomicrobium sp.]|nr:DUF1513 domain-containing protein [Hyphomicrobium sp.]
MAIDRRHFLIGTALTMASAGATQAFAGMLDGDLLGSGVAAGDLIAACRRPDGSYSVVVLSLDGTVLRELPLEGRGHDIALDKPSGQAVVFARRPGSFALAFDLHDRRQPVLFTTPANRHFYGHGVFGRDGRLLYATEHDNDTRDGLIGIYDASGGYRRIGEFPTYGIDPHEVILLADGKTLAVANGGIETHIETGREKLNLSTMQPSLAFIDSASGRLLSQHMQRASLHKLSIRHLAQDARGLVWFGCQWEGGRGDAGARRMRRPRSAAADRRAGKADGCGAGRVHRRRCRQWRWAHHCGFGSARRPHHLYRHRARSDHRRDAADGWLRCDGGFALRVRDELRHGRVADRSAGPHSSGNDDLSRPRVRQSPAPHRLRSSRAWRRSDEVRASRACRCARQRTQ